MKGDKEAELGDDVARDLELRFEETVELRDTYLHNFKQDLEAITGDAKIFKEQVDELRSGELPAFQDLCDKRQMVHEKREAAFYIEENLTKDEKEFTQGLLMNLASKLVIKEHRLRYQKEQFDRFFASMVTPHFSRD